MTKDNYFKTEYFACINVKTSVSEKTSLDVQDCDHSNDHSYKLVDMFNNMPLEDIENLSSIQIRKYTEKKNRVDTGATHECTGLVTFNLIDGQFSESANNYREPLKRHIKIIDEINEIIRAKKAAKEEQVSSATISRNDTHKDFNPATNTDHAKASKVMLEELRADLREVELDMFASKPAILDIYQDNLKKFDGTDCKIAQKYVEMIRSLIEKNRPQEEAQEETKHFYDFVGYMLSEGHVDTTQDTQDIINDLVIEYVDECKNSGYDLPVSFCDDVDRWHVASIIQSHLNIEARYYRERFEKIQKYLYALKEI